MDSTTPVISNSSSSAATAEVDNNSASKIAEASKSNSNSVEKDEMFVSGDEDEQFEEAVDDAVLEEDEEDGVRVGEEKAGVELGENRELGGVVDGGGAGGGVVDKGAGEVSGGEAEKGKDAVFGNSGLSDEGKNGVQEEEKGKDAVLENSGLNDEVRNGVQEEEKGKEAVSENSGLNDEEKNEVQEEEEEEVSEVVEGGSGSDAKTDGVESSVVDSGDTKVVVAEGGVKVTSEGDSVVEDVNADVSGAGVAVVGNVEESKGSDDGDKAAAVVETEPVNVHNQFTQIDNDVEEPLELKSDSVRGDENADVEEGAGEASLGKKEEDTVSANPVLNEGVNSGVDVTSDNKEIVNEQVQEDEVRKVGEEGNNLDGKIDGVISGIAESADSQMVEENGGDKDAAVVESENLNMDNQFSQISNDNKEPMGLTSEGLEPKSANSDGNAEVESVGIKSGTAGLVKEDAEEVPKFADSVGERHENGGTIPATSHDDNESSGLLDSKDPSSTGPAIDSNVIQTHVSTGEPASSAIEDRPERGIDEEFSAGTSQINENEQNALSESAVGINSEDGISEFDEEREAKPNDGSIQKQGLVFENSEVAKQFLEALEQESSFGSHPGAGGSHDYSSKIDGEIVTESDEEADDDEDRSGKELFDSAALTALLKAAAGESSNGGSVSITSQDGTGLFSVERPAGLGSSIRSLKPASRQIRPNIFTSTDVTASGDSENHLSEEEKKKLENLQQIRIKFLRLLHRLGHSSDDSMAAQVLYRLSLLGGRHSGQLFNLESAKATALQQELNEQDDLDFSINVLVLGKSGTGKSATINSIFGEERSQINAFEMATDAVKEIVGTVHGVKFRIFDTPGLRSSAVDQNVNRKILSSVKKFTKKCSPDIVLYVDRLDTQTKDLSDLLLLRSITSSLGPSIWRNAIVTLTHAASAPPEGPSGSPLSYEVFVAQRSHIVQQSIGQSVGDLRMMNPSLMNPVSLVENHPSCRKNKDGQKVLPNGQSWRSQLLLLCYSLKILSEANSLSKAQSKVDQKKLFGFRVRAPPLPYLLSSLLQCRTHPKLSTDQGIDNGDSDVDFADLSDSEDEVEEDEYDQLPPFMPLKKAQLAVLSKEQKQAYLEEYDYRVKLLQKKQWKEELKRIKEIKKRKIDGDVRSNSSDDVEQDDGAPATVPVPLPDMIMPPSFDGDNPAYRYRFLEPTSQFLARPVLDTHGWDHDCGYDGVNVEHSLAFASRFPAALAVQMTKDKKEFNIHFDSSVATKHGENGSTMAGFDIQHIGKQIGYTVRGETKIKNLKRNKAAAGVSVTFLGENIATGLKLEDQIALGKRLMLVGSTGTVRSQGDAAYGTNLEIRVRDADYPIGQNQSSLGLSLVKWRGDLALGANLQSQFSVGRSSKIAVRMGLNNKRSGQISVRTSSSDQLQIALVGILPIVMAIYKTIRPGVSENYPFY